MALKSRAPPHHSRSRKQTPYPLKKKKKMELFHFRALKCMED
nr:MAG TPA: hypothetical protein [Caudoviricetes sp.]